MQIDDVTSFLNNQTYQKKPDRQTEQKLVLGKDFS